MAPLALTVESADAASGQPSEPLGRRTPTRRLGHLLADGTVFSTFLLVPLLASPRFWDQFTTVKWYGLECLAAAWFLVELLLCGSRGWPDLVRRRPVACALLAALVLGSSLRAGAAWAVQPLLERLCFVMLALCSFWYFRRNGRRMGLIVLAVALATACVDALGLAQAFGLRPLAALTAGDQRSATFGNVNMAAQFLGFSILLLLWGDALTRGRHPRVVAAARGALIACSLVYLYLLSSRSVVLALSCAALLHLALRRRAARSLLWIAGALGLAGLLAIQFGPGNSLGAELRANKPEALALRLAVWEGSLRMVRDHPLGVGSGRFGDAFIPYRTGVGPAPSEALLFQHPHNEYLRALAEEGVVFCALAAALLASLLRRLHCSPVIDRWRSEVGTLLGPLAVFYAVEAFFQFPLALAFGCAMGAVLLGLAFACAEPLPGSHDAAVGAPVGSRRGRWLWAGAAVLLAGGALAALWRVAASEYLFVNGGDDADSQDRACRLNPRNTPACVTAAWLHARRGDHAGARARLLRVLESSPYDPPAIKLLGEVALASGDEDVGCLCLWIYDELFREQSSVHERLHGLCGRERLASFAARVAMPHYGTFPLLRGGAFR